MLINMSAKAGAGIIKKLRSVNRLYVLLLLGAIVVVGLSAYLLLREDNTPSKSQTNSNSTPKGVASPEQVESTYKTSINESLASKDYESYQISQRAIAIQYYSNDNFDSAERVLKKVIDTVPKSELDPVNLTLLAAVYKGKGNESAYKDYKAQAVTALREDGRNDEANDLEKEEFTNR